MAGSSFIARRRGFMRRRMCSVKRIFKIFAIASVVAVVATLFILQVLNDAREIRRSRKDTHANVDDEDANSHIRRRDDDYADGDHTLISELASADAYNTVLLVGASIDYSHFAKNMMCRVDELNMHNVLLTAFDKDIYAYGQDQQFPTINSGHYYSDVSDSSIISDGVGHSSNGLNRITTMKSEQILRLLEQNINVLWSDVDVYFFYDPVPVVWDILGLTGADIVVQSNAPIADPRANSHVNDGFYLVSANSNTVMAFRSIVADIKSSTEPEQSFSKILCGVKQEYAHGSNMCISGEDGGNVKTVFLDRGLFPHGDIYWHANDSKTRHLYPELFPANPVIAHADWSAASIPSNQGNAATVSTVGPMEKQNYLRNAGMWLLEEHGSDTDIADKKCINRRIPGH